jgi:LemA protein
MISAQEPLKSVRAQVDNMYERRKDLVPQVAAVVKKYAEYESGTFMGVTALRSQAGNMDALNAMIAKGDIKSDQFSSLLASTMGGIKISMEAYPELKADTQFTNLYTTLEGSENRIRTSIKDYNDAISTYNIKTRTFPRNLVGGIFGFTALERIAPPAGKDITAVPDVSQLLK